MIGALIGKKGKNIQNIQTQSRCKILVKDYPVENGGQYIAIEGNKKQDDFSSILSLLLIKRKFQLTSFIKNKFFYLRFEEKYQQSPKYTP